MNKLKGIVKNVLTSDHISIVDIDVDGWMFSSILIGTVENTDYLTEGRDVYVIFKETEVSIAKNLSGEISLRNRMKSVIKSIEKGKVLSRITLDFAGKTITSVITTRSTEKLRLQPGDEVEGLVKANEVTLMGV